MGREKNKPSSAEPDLLGLYRQLLLIRKFELQVVELSQQALVCGAAHPYTGEEAIAAGACAALDEGDYVLSNHRGHGHCIAKGGDIKLMMAELLGRANGYCKGRGGSMHIVDTAKGILGANGIVAGGMPISVGAGLASTSFGDSAVTLCFFGDGGSNQGSFHESLNLASLWKLPVVYICENNCYAVSTNVSDAVAAESIAARASAYLMPGEVVDGNDVLAVRRAVKTAVERGRAGEGPSLIECRTYRIEGHYVGDPCKYRSKEELAEWKARDPITRFNEYLLKQGHSKEALEQIEAEVDAAIADAVEFAKQSPEPDAAGVEEHVYAPVEVSAAEERKPRDGEREITYREAINEALAEELERDERVFLVGEDIGLHGGAFQVTAGLYERFGGERVRNTPISEAAIVGCAIGAAIRGLRPVAEIMYVDFTTLAMDQIANQAAKMRYMFGGQLNVPLVIRAPGGSGGRGNAAQHSQSLEAWFMHVPGLKVVMPSTPYDAKGLLKSAIRDPNPVVFIEHKVLYNTKGPVPEGDYAIPLGRADVKRAGEALTIIATSRMVIRALEAAAQLAEEGIEAEIVDPRTLVPLDMPTIAGSAQKTGRVLIVTEDCQTAGSAAEILSRVTEACFDDLDAPVKRLCGLDVPIPYSRILEQAAVPSVEKIIEEAKRLAT